MSEIYFCGQRNKSLSMAGVDNYKFINFLEELIKRRCNDSEFKLSFGELYLRCNIF